ncbi:MAG: ComEC/Rec2 family competence protein, partial [Planctomycetota bacterium]
MYDIQRKLKYIDFALTGIPGLLKAAASTCPAFFAATGLIAGVVAGDYLQGQGLIFLLMTIVSMVLAAGLFVLKKDEYSPLVFGIIVFFGFMGAGGMRINALYQPKANDIRVLVGSERKLGTIRGTVLNDARINQQRDWEFARFSYSDPSSSFYMKIREVQTSAGWSEVRGIVRVQVSEPVMDIEAGDYIEAYCWLSRFEGAKNPGQFDFERYLKNKGVRIGASIRSRDAISVLDKNYGFFTSIKNKFRGKVIQALLSDTSIEESNKALLQALLLGYRGDIDKKTYRAFRETGLLHFISLSGMHLGILAGFIWQLCKLSGILKRGRAIICIAALIVYLLIVPPRAPTLRAAIICFVFCLSFLFQRKTNQLNNLSLAAIVLLLIRPAELFEAGWQLSFASVAGILTFTERFQFYINDKTADWLWLEEWQKRNSYFRAVTKSLFSIINLFCVGVSAWLGGAGILLYHFYTINPLTSIWTVAVFPLVALILAIGYLKILVSFALPTLSFILGITVNSISALFIWMVKYIANLEISQILIGHVGILIIILYYCIIIFIAFFYIRRPLRKTVISIVLAAVLLLISGAIKWQHIYRSNLSMTVLDVGHGQAILAELPGGKNLLFDAGSISFKNTGQRIVVPFLNYKGTSNIDAIIISHNDIDHINGIPEIVESCNVKKVYAHKLFFRDIDEWGTGRFLESSLRQKGIEIQELGEELVSDSRSEIRFIWPPEVESEVEYLSDNDKSLVSSIKLA